MGKHFEYGKRIALLSWNLARSFGPGIWGISRWRDVQSYVMFIGYPRSGSSIIGALLDAHPNVIVAHEMHALLHVYAHFTRSQLFHLIACEARKKAAGGRHGGGYCYRVPGQWQGRCLTPMVIGDKHAEGTTLRLRARPRLLDRLRRTVQVPLRVFHVVRNPFDSITTIHRKSACHCIEPTLPAAIEHYFSLCETVKIVKGRLAPGELMEFRHEAFVADPRGFLRQACAFLAIEALPEYIEDCAGIVNPEPRKTRDRSLWGDETIAAVEQRMAEFPFLNGYSWEC